MSTQNFDINIQNIDELRKRYISFIQHGGIFINTDEDALPPNTAVQLNISLPEDPASHALNGQVVWINPPGTQSPLSPGFGIQFNDEPASQAFQEKVNSLLT